MSPLWKSPQQASGGQPHTAQAEEVFEALAAACKASRLSDWSEGYRPGAEALRLVAGAIVKERGALRPRSGMT